MGEELRSVFGNKREAKKKHPPRGSKSELYGAQLEEFGPVSVPSSWADPLDSFSFTMIYQDGRSKRGVVPGDAPCGARTESKRCVRAETFLPVPRALASSPQRFRSLLGLAPREEDAVAWPDSQKQPPG